MLTHIYVTKPRVKWSQLAFIEPMHQCNSFDSLWLSDAIWQHRTWSTLVQEMAWCRQATSHYLNQCCLIIHQVLWHSLEGKYIGTAIIDMSLKCTDLRLQPHLPGAIELKNWYLQVKSTGTLSSNDLQWLDKEGEGTRKIVSLMAVRWQVLFLALTWQRSYSLPSPDKMVSNPNLEHPGRSQLFTNPLVTFEIFWSDPNSGYSGRFYRSASQKYIQYGSTSRNEVWNFKWSKRII